MFFQKYVNALKSLSCIEVTRGISYNIDAGSDVKEKFLQWVSSLSLESHCSIFVWHFEAFKHYLFTETQVPSNLFYDLNLILLEHGSIQTLDQLTQATQINSDLLVNSMDKCKHLLDCLLKYYSCTTRTLKGCLLKTNSKNDSPSTNNHTPSNQQKSSINNNPSNTPPLPSNQQKTSSNNNNPSNNPPLPSKPKSSYRCSRCGQLKKSHTCPLKK